MASLSVIVPIYNVEKYLRRSLESLLNQTLTNIEIILVNDGSTDESLSICEEYARIDSRIIIINQENQGVSYARNVGIQHAKSEYIAFMDPDDDVDNKMYEILYSDILKSKVDIVLCNYKFVKRKNEIDEMLPYNTGMYGKDTVKELLLEMISSQYFDVPSSVMGSVCRGIYKKSIILKNNIFFPLDIRVKEDLVFNINYLLHAKDIYINGSSLYFYYENPNSAVTSYRTDMWKNECRFFETMSNILKDNNLYEDSLKRMANGWGIGLLSCIRNEMKSSNKISHAEKVRNIETYLNSPITLKYIPLINVKKSSIKGNIMAYLLRNKKAKLIYGAKLLKSYFK